MITEVRDVLNFPKIHNLLIAPYGSNVGKRGGAMLLLLLNKFSMSDDGKPNYEHFNISTTPVTNKIFQQVFLNTI